MLDFFLFLFLTRTEIYWNWSILLANVFLVWGEKCRSKGKLCLSAPFHVPQSPRSLDSVAVQFNSFSPSAAFITLPSKPTSSVRLSHHTRTHALQTELQVCAEKSLFVRLVTTFRTLSLKNGSSKLVYIDTCNGPCALSCIEKWHQKMYIIISSSSKTRFFGSA